jgi:hypothetical protein
MLVLLTRKISDEESAVMMVEAVSTSETSVNFTRLHGTTTKCTAIFRSTNSSDFSVIFNIRHKTGSKREGKIKATIRVFRCKRLETRPLKYNLNVLLLLRYSAVTLTLLVQPGG